MWRRSKAAPPGTLHFPKLPRCVSPLTALFALRPSPKHKSEPPSGSNYHSTEMTNEQMSQCHSLHAPSLLQQPYTYTHTRTHTRAQKSSLFSTHIFLQQEGNQTEQVKALTGVHLFCGENLGETRDERLVDSLSESRQPCR